MPVRINILTTLPAPGVGFGQVIDAKIDPDVLSLARAIGAHLESLVNAAPLVSHLPADVVGDIRLYEPALPIPLIDTPDSVFDIDVHLCPAEEFSDLSEIAGDDVEGFFAIDGEAFEGAPYATRFRVVWCADVARLASLLRSEACTYRDALLWLESWVATMPHEVFHAVDWIRNAAGFSPADIDLLSSYGFIDIADPLRNPETGEEDVEERVEEMAAQAMASFSFPTDVVDRLLLKAGGFGR